VRARRGLRLAAALAAGVAVVAVGAFLLLRMGGAGADPAGPAGEPLAASAAPTTAERGAAAPPDAGGAPEVEAAPGAPAADDPAPAAAADAPADDSAAGPGTIERIAWQRRDGGVDFEIDGGGPIAPSLVDHFTLGGERPRLVVRIAGVERPYTRGDLAVGGPLVERVRTGFHPAAAGAAGELRIVFDLTAPAAAAAVDVAGGRVRVRFEER
jgi:hypothetical protein